MILSLCFLTACTQQPQNAEIYEPVQPETIRGVWLFYREISMADENGGTAESYTKKIGAIFDKCTEYGINTVFFHVRPFADSFYNSALFPWSEYITGQQGVSVAYDPLEIAINLAHKRGISLHAWINPFRISFFKDANKLSDNNPAKKLLNAKSDRVCTLSNGIYFNPADTENHKLIIDGVREIVKNYNVDGVHIDDYFYPDTAKSIDKNQYNAYVKSGGELSLQAWRIQCINSFVSSLYSSVKAVNRNVIVSISPAGNINNNLTQLYADVERWGSVNGYCDWLIPQIYFGFEHSTLPYEKAMKQWEKCTTCKSVKLIAGLGAYKAVSKDTDEWGSDDIICRQWQCAEKAGYNGYVLFSYSSIVSDDFGNNADFLKNQTAIADEANPQ